MYLHLFLKVFTHGLVERQLIPDLFTIFMSKTLTYFLSVEWPLKALLFAVRVE